MKNDQVYDWGWIDGETGEVHKAKDIALEPPTEKQLALIRKIQRTGAAPRFTGKTKAEAIQYISEYIKFLH